FRLLVLRRGAPFRLGEAGEFELFAAGRAAPARRARVAGDVEGERLVPGIGEAGAAGGGAHLIGAALGSADGVRGFGNAAQEGEVGDEIALDPGRPAVVADA